ncbi:hypothetical protein [Marichromatium gracile]|uniref:Uncharacterized protein n=1 Tax=Marichromatium gracile TaxID=1048 RepID=A0A4R4AGQ2_MARGR|nr:hypothetical protein [Marichromatium gracile]TCW38411.1 hypothetical protein EDC29_102304 [Marichromatium gracile]
MPQRDLPLFLLLGTADHEGVTSKLKSTNTQFKKKLLDSSIQNWNTIFYYYEKYQIKGTIVKLTPHTYRAIASEEYKELAERLFHEIAQHPNIVFVYEALLSGLAEDPHQDDKEEQNPLFGHYFGQPRDVTLEIVNSMMKKHCLNVMPYKKNAELTVLATSFLEQNENNLLFRLYVPSERMWALEADKLLQLFRDYLSKVSGVSSRLDQYQTNQGVIYEFFGESEDSARDIAEDFDEFSKFMDICASDPSKAKVILRDKSLAATSIINIVDRYSKEARRLHVDLRQERERKILSIRHRLESELTDALPVNLDWDVITSIVDDTIPQAGFLGSALSLAQSPLKISGSENVAINLKPQIIQTVNGVVSQEIYGDQHIGHEAREILELINKYAENRKAELSSAVHEVLDPDAPKSDRLSAKQKLKGFLFGLGSKVTDAALEVLQKYIENQIGV